MDDLIALRSGAIAIASQAAEDLLLGSSSTQLKRLALGSATQVVRVNDAGTAVEYGDVASFRPSDAISIAMGY